MHMRHIVMRGLARCATFFILYMARFSKKKLLDTKRVLIFLYNLCLNHLSLWEERREIWSKTYIGLHVKHPFFLSDYNETSILSTDLRKILKYQISCKSVKWEPSCIFADWRTDMSKLKVVLRNFANALKNSVKTFLYPTLPDLRNSRVSFQIPRASPAFFSVRSDI